ncbi:class I SAM-dependent methyltransferase [Pseudobacter ginsenosidimutans]|uniref:Methyltransferase family protein n=1 Tax=Pseudobacter ginsenosidimutans TaxID=661488 RepID=A0A4V2F0P1_9BACT|nr:class I SAM-dependent methyltransferase [Pseudobacter ginsenosidimutans]RZS70811.1 methyltransferase family protein [Pseudobacter ginsenosidimutans]
MEQSEAIAMLKHPVLNYQKPSVWADLGSGSGVFTGALAALLPSGSSIVAVDMEEQALKKIQPYNGISITTMVADITKPISLPILDGILMANSIHYVKNKELFLDQLKQYLRPGGLLLIVEYEMEKANPWVPYPLGFSVMQGLLVKTGFTTPEKIGERTSIYNQAVMYSCVGKLL